MVDRSFCAIIVLTILGTALVITGTLFIVLGDRIITSKIKNECQLVPGTMVYNNWHDPPIPFYVSIYVFDLLDTDFLNGSSKPRLKQHGPFVYREDRQKVDIKLFDNETISYRELRKYTFEPSLSAELDSVTITTINLVYMILANYLQTEHVPAIFRRIVGELLSVQEKPIMQRTVKELLWGYHDPLLALLKSEFPDIILDDQVSVFQAAVAGAGSNTYLINDGVGQDEDNNERLNKVGEIESFNFQTELPYWSDKYANMINGTDSTIWHPNTKTNERIYTFISDICRSVYLDYDETRTNRFKIETYRYTLPNSVYSNSTDNQGFCMNSTGPNGTKVVQCLPSGLFSLKTCVSFSESMVSIPLPIIASSPHFLDADPSVQSAVQGLAPDEMKHRSFIDIEPMTGVVMNGSRRLQVNLNVVNDSAITAISHLNPFVYPMIWIDEHAEIDRKNADIFYKKVTLPITALHVLRYLALAVGVVCLIIVAILIGYIRYKKSGIGKPFPNPEDEASPLLF